MIRLTLVISSLGGGGAERVMATLANAWAAEGVAVTLVTLADRRGDKYPLHAAVNRVALDVAGRSPHVFTALRNNAVRLRSLRRALRAAQPDAIISFTTTVNLLVVLAVRGWRVPVIVSERSFVGAQPPRGMWRLVYRTLYRRAAAVVAQTRRGAVDLEARLSRPVVVIPNPVPDMPPAAARVAPYGRGQLVLAAGRLGVEKGFDILIDAFAMIAAEQPGWRLRIAGEGSARAALTEQIARHGLDGRVQLAGFDDDLPASMREADIFVLSSRYEGMPNALLEAMSLGLCCISSDCETGPREIIDSGSNGWLVPVADAPALAEALQMLMNDKTLRQRIGARAVEVRETHSLRSVLARWDALVATLLPSTGLGERGRLTTDAPRTGMHGRARESSPPEVARKPRVLFLIRSLRRGGAERQLVALAAGLRQSGWEVAVACFYAGGAFQRELERRDVPVIDLRKRGRWDVIGFLWRLWRALRQFEPDIVHGYLTVGNLLSLMARAACPGSHVVWGVRSSFIDRTRYDWMSRLTFALSCRMARGADRIIFNSQAGSTLHGAHGYPADRLVVIANGIDTDHFRFDETARQRMRREWGASDRDVLVGLIGRLDPMKDHPTFLQAAALLVAEHAPWRFVCVGEGGSGYAGELTTKARGLGLAGRMVWAGSCEDMVAAYSAMDIVVSSSFGEGFPNVVAEAMACGRPCVVTRVGDSAHLVADTGIVVPPRDPQALRDGIAQMRRRIESDSRAMALAARARVVDHFSTARLVSSSARVLENVRHRDCPLDGLAS
ncbi:MAG TPA: glycosyltransferase [Rhodanobacter sp.]|nr:glycosyltransferase [Rhodanobacter sp.]